MPRPRETYKKMHKLRTPYIPPVCEAAPEGYHHYICSPPHGEESEGRCKWCGEIKTHYNLLEWMR